MKVHVYCGNFVGPSVWHGLDYFEPNECDAELDLEVADEEIDTASYFCPGCRAHNQVRDHEVTGHGKAVPPKVPRV